MATHGLEYPFRRSILFLSYKLNALRLTLIMRLPLISYTATNV